MNRKFKAFTLMELLVAMVLSTLVIASAGMGFKFIMKQYKEFDKVNDNTSTLAALYAVMNNDVQGSEEVLKQGQDLLCRKDSQVVVYFFSGDFVLRVQGVGPSTPLRVTRVEGESGSGRIGESVRDTFKIKVDEMEMEEAENGLVEQLSFKMGENALVIEKEYGADKLLRLDK